MVSNVCAAPPSAITPAVEASAVGYVFDNGDAAAQEQHRCLAAFLDPITCARLADAGVGPGWHCLEVGAGGGSVARWLAARVAPGGCVLATDMTPSPAALALSGAPGLRVAAHDVTRDPLPENAFDLVTARLVLRYLPERDRILRKLLRSLRPGGLIQIDEFDHGYGPILLAPHDRARQLYHRFLEAKERMFAAAGADGHWGRHAAEAMRDAGFRAIDPVPYLQPWSANSPGVRLLLHTIRQLADRLVESGMTRAELDEVSSLLQHPDFRASSCVVYSIQGRRPA